MKKFLLFLIVASNFSSLFAVETYQQTIKVQFSSPSEAEKAQAEIMFLPDNKQMAFVTRWDDPNPRHIDMQKMLVQRGCTGTYYLNFDVAKNPDIEKYRQILALGGAMGSHSLTHRQQQTLGGNTIFSDITLERLIAESALDTPIVAFVLPNTTYKSPIDSRVAKIVGGAIVNSGHLTTSEPIKVEFDKYGIDETLPFFFGRVFVADDRNPNEEKFLASRKEILADVYTKKYKFITLGIHTWQPGKIGLQRLGKIIDKHVSDKLYFKCNANDFVAYATQRMLGKVEKVSVEDDTATFLITRARATTLGSNIPLSLKIKTSANKPSMELKVPHLVEHCPPEVIDYVETNDAKFVKSAEIEGVSALLSFDNSSKTLRAVLKTSAELKYPRLTFLVSPLYLNKPETFVLKNNGKGEYIAQLKLSPKAEYADLFYGTEFFAAEFNFVLNDKPQRLFVSTKSNNEVVTTNSIRDKSAFLNFIPKVDLPDSMIAEMSKKDAVLKPVKDIKWLKGSPKYINPNYATIAYNWKYSSPTSRRLVAFDVEAPKTGEFVFYTEDWFPRTIFVNGKMVPNFKSGNKIALDAGKNRVVIMITGDRSYHTNAILLAFVYGDKVLPVFSPKVEQ